MKCPECIKEGKKSTLNIGGMSVTAAGYRNYYDEDGDYHHHDPNKHKTYYSCSNGHIFYKEYYTPCNSCNFNHSETKDE
ncbi:MAG: hypothetical protein C5B43_00645 [Verrucomicrobia bacterium]|nr:MAG: hypothetical protein C5B43_00645 [Verrucomicrobiota bacterium]